MSVSDLTGERSPSRSGCSSGVARIIPAALALLRDPAVSHLAGAGKSKIRVKSAAERHSGFSAGTECWGGGLTSVRKPWGDNQSRDGVATGMSETGMGVSSAVCWSLRSYKGFGFISVCGEFSQGFNNCLSGV